MYEDYSGISSLVIESLASQTLQYKISQFEFPLLQLVLPKQKKFCEHI